MSQEEFREHFEASQSFFIESDHRMEGPTVVIAVPFNMNKRILENLPNTHSSVETTVPGPLKHILGLYGRFLQGVKEISDDYPGQVVLLDPMQDPLYTEHSKGMNKRVLEELGLSGDSRLEIHKIPRHVDRPVYIRDHYMVGKLGENNVVAVSQRELLMGSYISQFQRSTQGESMSRTNADALVHTLGILKSVSGREGAHTDIHIEGGNVITTSKYVFSLYDTLRSIAKDRQRNRLSDDDNSCFKAYCRSFEADGTRTALILDWDMRSKEQPIHHLDLIAQPITNSEGEEIILISDLELAFNILQENGFIKRSRKGNLKVMKHLIDEQLNREGDQDIDTYFDTLYLRSIYDNLTTYFDTKNIKALARYIRHIKRNIEECGYKTLPVPFLYSQKPIVPHTVDNPWAEIKGAASPVYAPVNGIFAYHRGRGKVFYTIGGIPCLDEYTKSALAPEGVDVVTINKMNPLAHHGFAGLRCASILV